MLATSSTIISRFAQVLGIVELHPSAPSVTVASTSAAGSRSPSEVIVVVVVVIAAAAVVVAVGGVDVITAVGGVVVSAEIPQAATTKVTTVSHTDSLRIGSPLPRG